MITDNAVEEYCLKHSSSESELLQKLYRETHLKTVYSRMISGPLQAALLKMLVRMIRPKNILEIGTFTGYATLAMAEAMDEDGRITTVDNNPEVTWIAEKYFKESEYGSKIELIHGNALDVLPSLQKNYDLVFIDADKENYPAYYELSKYLLRSGGFIIADNVLWDMKPLTPDEHTDKETKGIVAFNEKVAADVEVEKVMLPLRDGLFLIQKK